MDRSAILERVDHLVTTRAGANVSVDQLKSALGGVRELRSFLDASEADLAGRLADAVSFPEAALAETSRESLHSAYKTLERTRTLESAPGFADALHAARVTGGHVDAITRAGKSLEPEQREQLLERVESLVDIAAASTVEQFSRRVRDEAKRIAADDGIDRLQRQIRDTSLSTWVGDDGMWNIRGRFDPVTGLKLSARLDHTVQTLFAETAPESCPADPIEKQKHLRALALARSIEGTVGPGRAGRPEFVAVIDVAAGSDAASSRTGPCVEWPIPIEVPQRVLAEIIDKSDVTAVVVRNGVVLHAPGELNLGRTTRLANRAQRRALRGLYSDCAIPGCTTSYDRCKLHHIIWWRNGGRTDLDNLIPICSHHHGKIHNDNWVVEIGPQRQLTLRLPDGTIHNTGPPTRRAA